jgi:itaconate CoA-transferase
MCACVQFGVGGVPGIIVGALRDRKNFGGHTGLLSDGIASLIECGAITNRQKTADPGKSVFNVAMDSASTYALINDNPGIEYRMLTMSTTHGSSMRMITSYPSMP